MKGRPENVTLKINVAVKKNYFPPWNILETRGNVLQNLSTQVKCIKYALQPTPTIKIMAKIPKTT